ALNIFSQQSINGTILNAETDEVIPYASVMILNTFKGTSTDENGQFFLEEYDLKGNEKMIVQRLGFYTDTLTVQQVWNRKEIRLTPNEQNIDEVVIYPIDAFDLLQEALLQIPSNYYSPPVTQTAFYTQKVEGNNELLNHEEAYFQGVNFFHNEQDKLYVDVRKARGMLDMEMVKDLGKLVANSVDDDSLYIAENCGGLFSFTPDLDVLTEDVKGFFGEKGEKRYDYEYNGVVEMDGLIVHHVTFDQEDDLKKTLFRGSIYIDTASLAFVDVSVELSPQGVDFQKLIPLRFRMLAKLLGFSFEIYDVSVQVHYVQYNGFWIIDKGRSYLNGKISKRNGVAIAGYFEREYDVLKNESQSLYRNLSNKYDVIAPNSDDFENPDFWKMER
ncbi:MAG: carboxypeptidase-like regulatory domain-containing protein, partial [Chitinophagales bacterium]